MSALVGFIITSLAMAGAASFFDHVGERCPTVSVSCANKSGCFGPPPFYFRANVTNTNPGETISFEWTVSNGRIVGGQGTFMIEVADTKRPATATVKLHPNFIHEPEAYEALQDEHGETFAAEPVAELCTKSLGVARTSTEPGAVATGCMPTQVRSLTFCGERPVATAPGSVLVVD